MNAPKPKLLLADDSATIRKVVEMTFADEGIEVSSVPDGPSAMKSFVENEPDIVLVDSSLAGTDGYEICRTIKHDDTTRHIPVLLLVGSFEPFDHDAAERAGADGFITKPFHSIRDLVTRVSDLLTQPKYPAVPDPTPETEGTEDIENLYHNSLDGTQKLEDLESVDEMLLDLGRNGDAPTVEDTRVVPEQVVPEISAEPEPVDQDLGDTGLDDELIEAVTPAPLTNGSAPSEGAAQSIKGFDWSPGGIIRATPNKQRRLPVKEEEPEPDPDTPSDELVELVAQRVIERLSEQVIREIAKEAVPRIAEKLIREAVENEGKT